MRVRFRVTWSAVNSNDVNVFVTKLHRRPDHTAANAAKAVYCDFDCHLLQFGVINIIVNNNLAISEQFEQKIFILHKQKVILSNDLAKLYGVETKVLMQAVQRNLQRFPSDLCFN